MLWAFDSIAIAVGSATRVRLSAGYFRPTALDDAPDTISSYVAIATSDYWVKQWTESLLRLKFVMSWMIGMCMVPCLYRAWNPGATRSPSIFNGPSLHCRPNPSLDSFYATK